MEQALYKEKAILDLKDKYIIDKDENYIFGTISVVYVGKVIQDQPTETSPATYKEGYYVAVMTDRDIIFNNVIPGSNHKFAN